MDPLDAAEVFIVLSSPCRPSAPKLDCCVRLLLLLLSCPPSFWETTEPFGDLVVGSSPLEEDDAVAMLLDGLSLAAEDRLKPR